MAHQVTNRTVIHHKLIVMIDNVSFTKDGQLIQVLDLVQTGTGFGNAVVNHSNIVYNQSNSQVVNGEVPAANGQLLFN